MGTTDAPTDEALVAQVVSREDTAAYERLVERHQARVRNWLRQLTGNPAEADDLAQEAFVNAWIHIRSFSGKGRFLSWLMKIAYNAYLQSHRRQVRERHLVDALARLDTGRAVTQPTGETTIDLPTLLAALTDDERATMILCYAHGFSHAEVAELTGLPLGTVKSHLRRSKARIAAQFELSREPEQSIKA